MIGAEDVAGVAGENLVAFCDVDDRQAQASYKKYPTVPRFKDYRKMFDQMAKSIDAVVVSTPDHMHYPIARAAMELGKHVLVQKPLTHTVWEARELTKLARAKKLVTQMGNQGHAGEGLRTIFEHIRSGAIGEVKDVYIHTSRPMWRQGQTQGLSEQGIPKTLDWNLWLGVAPMRPFNNDYVPFKWRGWWDFGSGVIGDMGCHLMDAAFYALNLGGGFTVSAVTSPVSRLSPPSWSRVTYKFPARKAQHWIDGKWQSKEMPPVTLHWYDGEKIKLDLPPAAAAFCARHASYQIFVGDKGTIAANEYTGDVEVHMDTPVTVGKFLPRVQGGHYQEWIRACMGGPSAGSNVDHAGPLTEMVLLANVATRTGKEIIWDSAGLKITNVSEANQYLTKEYRKF
jgi:predicted dehydrogenase